MHHTHSFSVVWFTSYFLRVRVWWIRLNFSQTLFMCLKWLAWHGCFFSPHLPAWEFGEGTVPFVSNALTTVVAGQMSIGPMGFWSIFSSRVDIRSDHAGNVRIFCRTVYSLTMAGRRSRCYMSFGILSLIYTVRYDIYSLGYLFLNTSSNQWGRGL